MSLVPAQQASLVERDPVEAEVRSEVLRESAARLDAMSYVEGGGEGRAVNEMIEAEMAAMAREGLAEPALWATQPPRFGPMATAELERLGRGEELAPLDIARYNCERPEPTLDGDAQAWRKALLNCCAQLEHQANRVVNLELAESFAEVAWERHVQDLERLKLQLETLADAKEREAQLINLRRKAEQERLAPDLARLDRERAALLDKHLQLERANAEMRAAIARLESPPS